MASLCSRWRCCCWVICSILISRACCGAASTIAGAPENASFLRGRDGASIAVPVLHRDSAGSPFHRPEATRRERAQSAMRRSVQRARSLREMVRAGSSLAGPVMSAGQASAEYMVRMQLGTPPQELLLTIDTGSGLLWTQCRQCGACFRSQQESLYDPGNSSTYGRVSCSDPVCEAGGDPGLEIVTQNCSSRSGSECLYRYGYGDASFSQGELARDTLRIKSGFGSGGEIGGVVFGCGLNNQGLFEQESGILGLGRSGLGLPRQLAMASGAILFSKFRYCFTDRIKQENATSFLSFGTLQHDAHSLLDGFQSDSARKMLYTPFHVDPRAPLFYFLHMTGISVAGHRLLIDPSHLRLSFNSDGSVFGGGTVIDSGTTFTNLVDPVYRSLLWAFARASAALRIPSFRPNDPENIPFGLCYNITQKALDSAAFPSVSFFFRSDDKQLREIEIALSKNHVLVPADDDVFCLAFFSAGDVPATSFIGNFQQENFLIEYDLPNNRLGFKHAACAFQQA